MFGSAECWSGESDQSRKNCGRGEGDEAVEVLPTVKDVGMMGAVRAMKVVDYVRPMREEGFLEAL